MRLRRTLTALACISAVAGLLFVLGYLQSPSPALIWRELMNFGHVPLFALISLGLLGLFRSVFHRTERRAEWDYLFALGCGLAIGAVSEWVQFYGPRDADLWDFLRNVAGVLSALGVAVSLDRSLRPRAPWKRRATRVLLRLLAVVLVSCALAPVMGWAEAYRRRWVRMPTLCHFDSDWELRFMDPRSATLDLVPPPSGWSAASRERVGKLTIHPATYPGLIIFEPYPDWRSYGFLALDLFLEGDRPVSLGLRIDDLRHEGHYTDRFGTMLALEPGGNHVRIPLREVRLAPQGREMDMDQIYVVILFAIRPPEPITVYLADLRLEPE